MKGYVAIIAPPLKRLRMPVSRDLAFLLLVVVNLLILGFETYLAHSISGTIRPYEWIPVLLSPVAGLVLLVALWLKPRQSRLGLMLAVGVLLFSLVVGVLGTYFHLVRAMRPLALAGERISLLLLIWSPPLVAPASFALVSVLGLLALWPETALDSGVLRISATRHLTLPLSKSRLYFLLASLGILIASVSGVLDHARTDFSNLWLWAATLTGVLGTLVALFLGLLPHPSRADLMAYAVAMGILLAVGPLGTLLHLLTDLAVGNTIVIERFIRGAPLLAPLVFANMGLFGVLVLLDPDAEEAKPT